MAGIFGFFDYTKEGPGVDPHEPPKGAVATFFGILGRKFWDIIKINLEYLIFSLPFLLIAFVGSGYIMQLLWPQIQIDRIVQLMASYNPAQAGNLDDLRAAAATLILLFNLILAGTLFGLTYFNFGPTLGGITKLLRNYGREEHAFLWMDFKESFVRNWKLTLPASIISSLVILLMAIAVTFYGQANMNRYLSILLSAILWIGFFYFTMMQMYLYPILITFDLSLKNAYRNSALFVILRLPFNVGIILLQLIILAGIPITIYVFLPNVGPLIIMAYYLFFAFGFNYLLTNFFVWRQLERFMIKPMQDAATEVEAEAVEVSAYDEDPEYDDVYDEDYDEAEDESDVPEPEGAPA